MEAYRNRTFQMFEGVGRSEGMGRVIDIFLVVLIILNVAAVVVETVAELRIAYRQYFFGFEIFLVLGRIAAVFLHFYLNQ